MTISGIIVLTVSLLICFGGFVISILATLKTNIEEKEKTEIKNLDSGKK